MADPAASSPHAAQAEPPPPSSAVSPRPRARWPHRFAQVLAGLAVGLVIAEAAFHYRDHGATPAIAQEAIQMQTIVNLVSAGIGLAWVPASMMQLQRPGVVYRPLAGATLECETSLVWREPAPPVVQRFLTGLRPVVAAERRQSRLSPPQRKVSR